MKQFLLASTLIAVPVAAFTLFNVLLQPATASVAGGASLGDLTPLKTIVSDVEKIAATGDLAAAQTRITDFETAWDDDEPAMRPLNADAWGNVDMAADAALKALRAGTPQADKVNATLTALMASLDDPSGAGSAAGTADGTAMVGSIAVTDAKGRALPCEDMLKAVATTLAATTRPDADKTAAGALQAKALERCNADDDQRADAFSAQALGLLTK